MIDKLWIANKAFIMHKGKVLVIRESAKYADRVHEGEYDTPGGRIQPGERFDEALLREVKEETGLDVKIGEPFFVNEWRPVVRGENWQVIGVFFECTADRDEVKLSEDHDHYKWIDPKNYKEEHVIANLHPAFETYLRKHESKD